MIEWWVIADEKDDRIGRMTGPYFDVPCALGRGGLVAAADKKEGDGKTPMGSWPVRRILYRPDKEEEPVSKFPITALSPTTGWCDAPQDTAYNQIVRHPWRASAEQLWRDDDVYDLIMVLGHNDDPVVPGSGSAIFVHIAREGFTPTEGCVAIAHDAIRKLITLMDIKDRIVIKRV
jgi:L,D-peptidoglycan transpeptidase YkuD (ErfK/YbiS/YcfS/YnhG family)